MNRIAILLMAVILSSCKDTEQKPETSRSLAISSTSSSDEKLISSTSTPPTIFEEVIPTVAEEAVIETPQISEEEAKMLKEARAKVISTRESQIGKNFVSLTLGKKVFQNATIKDINDAGVKVSHTSGVAVINWDKIPSQARQALGFDSRAFADELLQHEKLLKEQQKLREQQIALQNTPEYKEAKEAEHRKAAAEAEAKKQTNLAYFIDKTISEISRGRTAIKNLESQKRALERKYRDEDIKARTIKATRSDLIYGNERYGGIKTSRQDRAKNISKVDGAISAAKYKLSQLETELEKLRRQKS